MFPKKILIVHFIDYWWIDKKTVISDYISINFVDRVFDLPNSYTAFENLMASYGYTIQIYCDFSGYSDMAIGVCFIVRF